MRNTSTQKPKNPFPPKTSSTKRKAHVASLQEQVATLQARNTSLVQEHSALQTKVSKGKETIHKLNTDLFHVRATYKELCQLFYASALKKFTDPTLPATLAERSSGSGSRADLHKPVTLTLAQTQARKEFTKILAAVSRVSLGLTPTAPDDNEPEPDV